MRIKNIKGKPLLDAPVESWSWLQVSSEDVRLFNEHLERSRPRQGNDLAKDHYYMRELHYPQQVTDEDIRWMTSFLNMFRETPNDLPLAIQLFHMKALGAIEGPTEDDMSKLPGALTRSRERGIGDLIAQAHYYLRKLGIQTEITDGDLDLMKGALRQLGGGADGVTGLMGSSLAQQLYLMKKIGVEEPITGKDVEVIRRKISQRRREGNGELLMKELYYAGKIIQHDADKTPMPPVKEFGR